MLFADTAIVYANRSAALFHLEEYLLSKRDAEMAFSLNYPEELHYKLYERVGCCCQQLGLESEATRSFRQALKSLDQCGLDQVKKNKGKKALEELIKNVGITTNNLMSK